MRIHLLNESKMETFVWSIKKNEDEKKLSKFGYPHVTCYTENTFSK